MQSKNSPTSDRIEHSLSAVVVHPNETGLLQSEQVFRWVVEQLSDGVALLDKQRRLVVWNRACERITGLARDEVIGRMFLEIVVLGLETPSSSDKVEKNIQAALDRISQTTRPGLTEIFDIDIPLANQKRSLQISIFPVQTDSERWIGMVFRDTTDYQRSQAQRQAHERYLTLLHDITETALAAADLPSMLQSLAEQLVDLIHADACLVTLWDENTQAIRDIAVSSSGCIVSDVSKTSFEAQITAEVLNGRSSIIIDELAKSPYAGKEFAIECPTSGLLVVPLVAGGQNFGAVFFLFETPHVFMTEEVAECEHTCRLVALTISKVLLIEESRQRAEEFETLARISRSMRIASTRAEIPPLILDQILDVFRMDGAAFMLHDPIAQDIVTELGRGKWESWTGLRIPDKGSISGLILSNGQIYHTANLAAESSFFFPEEVHSVQHAVGVPLIVQEKTIGILWVGSERPISDKLVRVFGAIGDTVGSAIHRQSLHEDLQTQLEALRITQARLLQSEKLAAIGKLIAGIAHEVNNPLTSVLLRAEFLRQQSLSGEAQQDVEKIISEARRAVNTVRDLLDFARQRTPERKLLQINDIIKASLELTAYELGSHSIKSETHLDPELPVTMVDSHQIQQVLINLINNAWQAIGETKKQGCLIITTQVKKSTFWGGEQDSDPMICIQFSDDGPGISQELLPHIFDPFFTTKPEGLGTGLGLSICHGIINEHEGHIWAESNPGQGTTFYIELPIIAQQTEIVEEEILPLQTQIAVAGRVLLIDDETSVLDVLSRMLQRKGYHVDTAKNGVAALACLFKSYYDLIVSDIRMPELDGPEFYQQVTKKDPRMAKRIIFTTGDTVNKSTQRFLDETDVPYLAKPFELDALLALMQKSMAQGAESAKDASDGDDNQ